MRDNIIRLLGKIKPIKGAGIEIGKGTVVDWSVKGAANDNLHKTGAGTLNVSKRQRSTVLTLIYW